MADRRTVGQRRRASDDSESRVSAAIQNAREKVSRESGGREGIDARAYGDDREAVDAAETDVDDDAVADAERSPEDVEGVPSSSAATPRGRVAEAKAAASQRISDLTSLQKERIKDKSTRAALQEALVTVAAASDGAPSMEAESDNVGKRAARSAQIGSPMSGGLRPVGDERNVSEMARTSAAESNELLDFGSDGLGMGPGASFGVETGAGGMGLSVGAGLLNASEETATDDSDGSGGGGALDVGLSDGGLL